MGKAGAQRSLLQNAENRSNTKCLTVGHLFAWICVVLDLVFLPFLIFAVAILLFRVYTTKPCDCYGYSDASAYVNIGACDTFISKWTESHDFICFNGQPYVKKSAWHPQYCRGGSAAGLCLAVGIISILLFHQYTLCIVCWAILFEHCVLSFIFHICWVVWCIIQILLFFVGFCFKLEIKCEDLRAFVIDVWIYNEFMKQFCTKAIKRTFKDVIWRFYSPKDDWITIYLYSRLIHLIPWCLLVSFVSIVPINQTGLNAFNCDKYGVDSNGDEYELKVNSFWTAVLQSNILFSAILMVIILIPILMSYRRIVFSCLECGSTNITEDETQRLYLRMIGKKYKKGQHKEPQQEIPFHSECTKEWFYGFIMGCLFVTALGLFVTAMIRATY